MPKLLDNLTAAPKQRSLTQVLWRGPTVDDANGGVTQTLLGRYLSCKERFRLKYVLGLEPTSGWNHRLGYGNMWHACEEALAYQQPWMKALCDYTAVELQTFPMDRETIEKWFKTCATQFPCYVEHWKKHPDVEHRIPVVSETVFNVPYRLPSGRLVYLRGKWDSGDLVPDGNNKGDWLQENKTKGDVDKLRMERQLKFDLQTMVYLISYRLHLRTTFPGSVTRVLRGVRYNVVRRPFSGGKGSIKQHKPTKSNPRGETEDEFYERLRIDYLDANPEEWFWRWNCYVFDQDIDRFRQETLDPVLENLCDDYEWYAWCARESHDVWDMLTRNKKFNHQPRHFRLPFGVYNAIAEGGSSEYDAYLETGSEAGLRRVDKLFGELV